MKDNKKTLEQILETWHIDGREVIGIFSYGSINTGLQTPTSDIDYRCIVMPKSFDDLIWNDKPYSKSSILKNGEDLDIQEIRNVHKILSRTNATYLETFKPAIYHINPKYKDFVMWFDKKGREISKLNLIKYWQATRGMIYRSIKDMEKKTSSKEGKVGYEEHQIHGFYPKRYMTALKFIRMLELVFIDGLDPYDVIDWREVEPEYIETLMKARKNESSLTVEEVIGECSTKIKNLESVMKDKIKDYKINQDLLDEIKFKINKELLEKFIV